MRVSSPRRHAMLEVHVHLLLFASVPKVVSFNIYTLLYKYLSVFSTVIGNGTSHIARS